MVILVLYKTVVWCFLWASKVKRLRLPDISNEGKILNYNISLVLLFFELSIWASYLKFRIEHYQLSDIEHYKKFCLSWLNHSYKLPLFRLLFSNLKLARYYIYISSHLKNLIKIKYTFCTLKDLTSEISIWFL